MSNYSHAVLSTHVGQNTHNDTNTAQFPPFHSLRPPPPPVSIGPERSGGRVVPVPFKTLWGTPVQSTLSRPVLLGHERCSALDSCSAEINTEREKRRRRQQMPKIFWIIFHQADSDRHTNEQQVEETCLDVLSLFSNINGRPFNKRCTHEPLC